MDETKTEGQKLQEKLFFKAANVWEKSGEDDKRDAFGFCEGYKKFLDTAKTEREFALEAGKLARQNGFVSLEDIIKGHKKLTPGMKIYNINRKKSVLMAVIGERSMADGVNIIGAPYRRAPSGFKAKPVI